MDNKQRVLVKQPENENIPMEVLANSIVKIAEASEALRKSRLKERTLLLLIQDYTKLSQRDIKAVLDALPLLEVAYLKPKPLKKAV